MTVEQVARAPAITPGSPSAWLLAARPKTLPAAIVPVLVGSGCATALDGFRGDGALAAGLGALWIQVGTNLANDVFDHERGADSPDRLGPLRAVAAGLLTPMQIRRGMVAAFALASLCGLYLVALAGWPVLAIGVASILAGVGYTGGPFPLAYNGLGDLFVLLFFGFVAVCGTTFVQLESVPTLSVWASVPVGLLATAMLVVNNLRDAEQDARVGKRTLAVRLGPRLSMLEYDGLLGLAFLSLVPVSMAVPGEGGTIGRTLAGLPEPGPLWVLLPLLTAPYGLALSRQVRQRTGSALNDTLAGTARLLLLFGGLLALGLAMSGAG